MSTIIRDLKVRLGLDMGNYASDMKEATSATKQLDEGNRKTKMGFADMAGAVSLATQGFNLAKGAIEDIANTTVNYANDVRKLQSIIGATPQEASKLINAADDMGVSFDDLTKAMLGAIKKGYEPSVAGLGQLSDQYLSLQPGIERTKFLMDVFGKTGPEIARLMEQGSAGIKAMGDSIEGTARLMTDEGLASAEKYRVAMDDLGDTWMDLKLTAGQTVVPALTDVLELTTLLFQKRPDGLVAGYKTLFAGIKEVFTGHKDLKVATDEVEASLENVNETGFIYNGTLVAEKVETYEVANAMGAHYQTAQQVDQATIALRETTLGYNSAVKSSSDLLGKFSAELVYNKAAAKLDEEAALQLGRSLGLVDESTIAFYASLDTLNKKFDANHDGAISASEGAKEYARQVANLKYYIDSLQNKTVTVTVNSVNRSVGGGPQNDPNLNYSNTGTKKALGGSIAGGSPYWVGEQGAEPFFPSQNGRILSHSDAMHSMGVTNNYYLQGNYKYESEQSQVDKLKLLARLQ